MDTKQYIASGILELYVAGSLSEKENEEVYAAILASPELLAEVLAIEKTIVKLTAATKTDSPYSFNNIKQQLKVNNTKVVPIAKTNWLSYAGWAASIVIGSMLILMTSKNSELQQQIALEKDKATLKINEVEKITKELKLEKETVATNLAEAEKLIDVFRDKNIISVPLVGQKSAPEAYAKVYWNKKTNSIYLDAKGLPTPPKGKVYQVWSLKLSPLTPTSLGTIDTFTASTNKIFTIENANKSEAFGITLEPTGGSKQPTLDQLYTLGAVAKDS